MQLLKLVGNKAFVNFCNLRFSRSINSVDDEIHANVKWANSMCFRVGADTNWKQVNVIYLSQKHNVLV